MYGLRYCGVIFHFYQDRYFLFQPDERQATRSVGKLSLFVDLVFIQDDVRFVTQKIFSSSIENQSIYTSYFYSQLFHINLVHLALENLSINLKLISFFSLYYLQHRRWRQISLQTWISFHQIHRVRNRKSSEFRLNQVSSCCPKINLFLSPFSNDFFISLCMI